MKGKLYWTPCQCGLNLITMFTSFLRGSSTRIIGFLITTVIFFWHQKLCENRNKLIMNHLQPLFITLSIWRIEKNFYTRIPQNTLTIGIAYCFNVHNAHLNSVSNFYSKEAIFNRAQLAYFQFCCQNILMSDRSFWSVCCRDLPRWYVDPLSIIYVNQWSLTAMPSKLKMKSVCISVMKTSVVMYLFGWKIRISAGTPES